MAKNGLSISIEEFNNLPTNQKFSCLYENQVRTIELIRGYKFYYRLTMMVGSFLAMGLGTIFVMFIEHLKGG